MNLQLFKPRVWEQIERYVEWKGKRFSFSSTMDRELLTQFVKKEKIKDVNDVTLSDVEDFITNYSTQYYVSKAQKAVRCFLKFYQCRGYPCLPWKLLL